MSHSRQQLHNMYRQCGGNIRQMARQLKTTPQALTNRLMGLGIHVPKERIARPNIIVKLRREAAIKSGEVVTSKDVILGLKEKYGKIHIAAKALGVGESTLSRLCTMYGLPWRVINVKGSGELDR